MARRGLRGRQNLAALVLNILNKGAEIILYNSSQSPCAVDQRGIIQISNAEYRLDRKDGLCDPWSVRISNDAGHPEGESICRACAVTKVPESL